MASSEQGAPMDLDRLADDPEPHVPPANLEVNFRYAREQFEKDISPLYDEFVKAVGGTRGLVANLRDAKNNASGSYKDYDNVKFNVVVAGEPKTGKSTFLNTATYPEGKGSMPLHRGVGRDSQTKMLHRLCKHATLSVELEPLPVKVLRQHMEEEAAFEDPELKVDAREQQRAALKEKLATITDDYQVPAMTVDELFADNSMYQELAANRNRTPEDGAEWMCFISREIRALSPVDSCQYVLVFRAPWFHLPEKMSLWDIPGWVQDRFEAITRYAFEQANVVAVTPNRTVKIDNLVPLFRRGAIHNIRKPPVLVIVEQSSVEELRPLDVRVAYNRKFVGFAVMQVPQLGSLDDRAKLIEHLQQNLTVLHVVVHTAKDSVWFELPDNLCGEAGARIMTSALRGPMGTAYLAVSSFLFQFKRAVQLASRPESVISKESKEKIMKKLSANASKLIRSYASDPSVKNFSNELFDLVEDECRQLIAEAPNETMMRHAELRKYLAGYVRDLAIETCQSQFSTLSSQILELLVQQMVQELEGADVDETMVADASQELQDAFDLLNDDPVLQVALKTLNDQAVEAIHAHLDQTLAGFFSEDPFVGDQPPEQLKDKATRTAVDFALSFSERVVGGGVSQSHAPPPPGVVAMWARYWEQHLVTKGIQQVSVVLAPFATEHKRVKTAPDADDAERVRDVAKRAAKKLKTLIKSLKSMIKEENESFLHTHKSIHNPFPKPREYPDQRGPQPYEKAMQRAPLVKGKPRRLELHVPAAAAADDHADRDFAADHMLLLDRVEASEDGIRLHVQATAVFGRAVDDFVAAYHKEARDCIDPVIICSHPRDPTRLSQQTKFNFFLRGPDDTVLDGKRHLIFVLCSSAQAQAHREHLFLNKEVASGIFLLVIDPPGFPENVGPAWFIEAAKLLAEWLQDEPRSLPYYVRMTPNVISGREASALLRTLSCSMARLLRGLRIFVAHVNEKDAGDLEAVIKEVHSKAMEYISKLGPEDLVPGMTLYADLMPLITQMANVKPTARQQVEFEGQLKKLETFLVSKLGAGFAGFRPKVQYRATSCSPATVSQAFMSWLNRDHDVLKKMLQEGDEYNFQVQHVRPGVTTLSQTTQVLVVTVTQRDIHVVDDDALCCPQPFADDFYTEYTKLEGRLAVTVAAHRQLACLLTDFFSISYYNDRKTKSTPDVVPENAGWNMQYRRPFLYKLCSPGRPVLPHLHSNDDQLRQQLAACVHLSVSTVFDTPAQLLSHLAATGYFGDGADSDSLRSRLLEPSPMKLTKGIRDALTSIFVRRMQLPQAPDDQQLLAAVSAFLRDKYEHKLKPLEFDFLHALVCVSRVPIRVFCCLRGDAARVSGFSLGGAAANYGAAKRINIALMSSGCYAKLDPLPGYKDDDDDDDDEKESEADGPAKTPKKKRGKKQAASAAQSPGAAAETGMETRPAAADRSEAAAATATPAATTTGSAMNVDEDDDDDYSASSPELPVYLTSRKRKLDVAATAAAFDYNSDDDNDQPAAKKPRAGEKK